MQAAERKIRRFTKPVLIGLSALFFACIVIAGVQKLSPLISIVSKNKISPQSVASLIFQKEPNVKQLNGRTNIILLGVSGGNHDGANLTDSIIFVSLDFKNKDAVIISVPRDIWIPSLKTKINSVYYYGEKKQEGGGFILTKSSISEVLGQQPAYAVKLDFSAFEKIIDIVGGIDIDVEKAFVDKKYPIPGKENDFCAGDPEFNCRYETLTIAKGLQHMDGDRALKYVRSRYSEESEGTDFSRSRRQQEVISAIITKVKPMVKINNLPTVKKLFDEIYKNIKTDLTLPEILSLGKYYYFNQGLNLRKLVLDTGDSVNKIPGLLNNPPLWEYDGQWVLAPRTGNFDEIHDFISCELQRKKCEVKKSPVSS